MARKAKTRLRRDEIDHLMMAIRVGGPGLSLDGGKPDMSGFRWIESPKGRAFADPFLIERANETWLFFEDFDYTTGRGHISCARVDARGDIGPPRTALATDHHLSYPYVFEDTGSVYMIPESSEAGATRLYRAAKFPFKWDEVSVIDDHSSVDTSVIKQDGIWWIFSTILEPRGNSTMLMLSYADTLDAAWTAHPMNPISLDVGNARGAGALAIVDGRLVRPSQDCGPTYGHSITFHEVLEMSRTTYRERPILTIDPSWHPGLAGTHTYNRSGAVEVIDGKVRTRRNQVS